MNLEHTKFDCIRTLLLLAVVTMVAVFVVVVQPAIAHAEADAECPDGNCVATGTDAVPANYNNTRSNRSTIADPNICDGVTCADGSCAATVDECSVSEAEAANYNNTRSNRSSAASPDTEDCNDTDPSCSPEAPVQAEGVDDDCDGEVCGDTDHLGTDPDTDDRPRDNATDWVVSWGEGEANTEPGSGSCEGADCPVEAAPPVGVAPDAVDPDSDDDGLSDGSETDRAQNHNSSRSNRTDGIILDTNICDGVKCPDGSCAPTAGACTAAEAVNLRLFESAFEEYYPDNDDDGFGETAARTTFLKFDDIKGEVRLDEATGERRLQTVTVAASDVRAWTPEDREAFSSLRQQVASNTPEATSLRITQHLLDDDQIESIQVTEDQTEVRYNATIRLFGLIPMQREVRAVAAPGEAITIEYPWYRFLSSTPDTDMITNLFSNLSL